MKLMADRVLRSSVIFNLENWLIVDEIRSSKRSSLGLCDMSVENNGKLFALDNDCQVYLPKY